MQINIKVTGTAHERFIGLCEKLAMPQGAVLEKAVDALLRELEKK